MSDFTLTIPERIVEQARKAIVGSDLSLEQVLLRQLESAFLESDEERDHNPLSKLPVDEQNELNAMKFLSDDALWTITREQMASAKQARMQVLMDANNFGTISDDESAELEKLINEGNRLTLLKAQAALTLVERGHKVIPEMMAGADE